MFDLNLNDIPSDKFVTMNVMKLWFEQKGRNGENTFLGIEETQSNN